MNSKVLLSVILLLHLLILTCHQTSGIFYCDTVEDKFISNNDFYNTIPYNNTINSSPLPIGNTLVSLDVDNNFNYFVQSIFLSGLANSSWPMHCHDNRHTGQSPYSTANITSLEKWRFRTIEGVDGGPIVGPDGTIYFGDKHRDFYAVYPNGTMKWKYHMQDHWVTSTPALAEDGTLYVSSWDWYLYAFNASTGTVKWKAGLGASSMSSPAIADDGTIYLGTLDNKVFAINPNGTRKWMYETGYKISSHPAVGDDGTVYIGSADDYLYALNPNGTLRWRYKTGDWIMGSPSIAADGTVYVGSFDDYLYALYPENGTMIWRAYTGVGTKSTPSIAFDGTIYVGSEKLYAINPNGTEKWVFEYGPYYYTDYSAPAISSEGIIYIAATKNGVDGGDLFAINPDGLLRWRKRISYEWIDSSPCIAADGTVYIGSQADVALGYLHAFGPVDSNNPPATPVISGRVKGHVNTEHWWQFRTYDPDNNPVQFYIDWGDGSDGWVHEHASGEPAIYYHTYTEKGSYTIHAKARDTLGEESDWATYAIRIPYSYTFYPGWQWLQQYFPLLARLIDSLFQFD